MTHKTSGTRGKNPDGFDQVQAIWEKVYSAHSGGKLEEMYARSDWPTYFKASQLLIQDKKKRAASINQKPLEALIDKGCLGVVLKLILIRDFCSNRTIPTFVDFYKSTAKNLGINERGINSSYLRGMLNIASSMHITDDLVMRSPDPELLSTILLHMVNQERTSRRGLKALPDDINLLATRHNTYRAVQDFYHLLDSEPDDEQPMLTNREFLLGNSNSQRRIFFEEVLTMIRGSQSMLINVHAESMWNGLTAFSEHLVRTIKDEGQRVLFLPLRRRVAAESAELRESKSDTLGLSDFLGIVNHFVNEGLAATLVEANPVSDADQGIMKTLDMIRSRLTQESFTFVFDGYYDPYPEQGARTGRILENIIADDHFEFVLSRLLEPSISLSKNAEGLSIFRQNRFIVTSNRPLRQVTDIAWLPGMRNVDYPLPHYAPTDRKQVLSACVQNKTTIRGLTNMTALAKVEKNDSLDLLMDGALSLVRDIVGEKLKAEGVVRSWVEHIESPSTAMTVIFEELMRFIKQSKPVWYETILIVALAPEGCRIESIQRLAVRSEGIYKAYRPLARSLEAEKVNQLVEQIQEMVNVGEQLIGYLRSEKFDGVDGFEHPVEFTENIHRHTLATSPSTITDRTIDFRLPEARLQLQHIARNDPEFHAPSVHRLLSELTLQHQIIGFRHAQEDSYRSIRQWRRILSAIYHGLLSLTTSITNGRLTLESTELVAREGDVPANGKDFHLYLYVTCYRVALEQIGLWRLNQLFGLDDLKIELLQLFERPYLLKKDASGSAPRKSATDLFTIRSLEGRHQSLAIDHIFSLIHAHLARGRPNIGRVQLSKLVGGGPVDTDPQRWFTPAQDSKRFLRDMDISLQECRVFPESAWRERVSRLIGPTVLDALEFSVSEYALSLYGYIQNAGVTTFPQMQLSKTLIDALNNRLIICTNSKEISGLLKAVRETLHRVAEEDATRADFTVTNVKLPVAKQERDRYWYLPVIPDEFLVSSDQVASLFCRSFARFQLCEALRRFTFSMVPHERGFIMKGAQLHIAVRAALRLDRELRRSGFNSIEASPFEQSARELADQLVLYNFQQPRERAELLILESSIARGAALRSQGVEYLQFAQECLESVEKILQGMNHVSRSRLRLCLERSKVHEQWVLYHLSQGDINDAKGFFDLCQYDRASIERIIAVSDCPYWCLLAYRQARRLDEVLGQIENTRADNL